MFNIEPVVCSTDGCRVNNACYRSNPGDCVLPFNVGTCNFPSNIRVALHCVLSTALEMIYGNRYTSWNQEVVALWQSQNRTQVCSCPWARWLPVFPKTVQRSQCRLKRGGLSSFDCITYTWMSRGGSHLDNEGQTKQQPLLSFWLATMTDIKMSPIHVMDLARPRVAGLRPSTPLCHPITLF